jgi:hypothetical protein
VGKEEYRETLRPRIDRAVAQLQQADPDHLAERSGSLRTADGHELAFLGTDYAVGWPDLEVRTSGGDACREELRILLLDYLRLSDGSRPTGKWIGYQELPHGAFYRNAFQGYSGDQLVRDLRGSVEAFRRGAASLGGERLDEMGDSAYAFRVLPNLPLAVVWWAGDEEFTAHATVLFDEVADRYLPTDGLAIVGRILCRMLAKEAPA